MAHRLVSEPGFYTLDPVVNARWPQPEWVDLTKIVIPEYQRYADDKRIKRISAKFEPARVRLPACIKRSNGTIVCYDGQHTIQAMLDEGVRYSWVTTVAGLTRDEEAMLFADQHDEVKPPAPLDKSYSAYHAFLAGGRGPKAMEASQLFGALSEADWKYDRTHTKGYPDCSAGMVIGTTEGIKDVYRSYGRKGLVSTLIFISEVWPNTTAAAKPNFIRALGHLVNLYGDDLTDDMKQRLRYYPIEVIEEKVKGQGSQFNKAIGMARFIVRDVLKDYRLVVRGVLRTNGKRPK